MQGKEHHQSQQTRTYQPTPRTYKRHLQRLNYFTPTTFIRPLYVLYISLLGNYCTSDEFLICNNDEGLTESSPERKCKRL